jgi:hypothetical protein
MEIDASRVRTHVLGFDLYALALEHEATGDFKKARLCYEQSAQTGFIPALNNLGWLYRIGKDPRCVECFAKASRFGYALAIQNLAEMFEVGELVSKDLVQAKLLYEHAASQKTEHEDPDSLQVEGLDTAILESRAKMVWFLPNLIEFKDEAIAWLTSALSPNSDLILQNDIGARAKRHQEMTEKLLFDVNHRG